MESDYTSNANNTNQTTTSDHDDPRAPNNPLVLRSSYDIDVVRLIGQHLLDLGLKQTASLLMKESGLQQFDHPLPLKLKELILAAEWDKVNLLLDDIVGLILSPKQQHQQQLHRQSLNNVSSSHSSSSSKQTRSSNKQQNGCSPNTRTTTSTTTTSETTPTATNGNNNTSSTDTTINGSGSDGDQGQQQQQQQQRTLIASAIRRIISEQKFLELIDDNDRVKALRCLRCEITPLCKDVKHIQFLTSLIMCKSNEEFRLKANWCGKGQQSRQMLFDRVSSIIPPSMMLPPKRLETLLNQAVLLQRERCGLHLRRTKQQAQSGCQQQQKLQRVSQAYNETSKTTNTIEKSSIQTSHPMIMSNKVNSTIIISENDNIGCNGLCNQMDEIQSKQHRQLLMSSQQASSSSSSQARSTSSSLVVNTRSTATASGASTNIAGSSTQQQPPPSNNDDSKNPTNNGINKHNSDTNGSHAKKDEAQQASMEDDDEDDDDDGDGVDEDEDDDDDETILMHCDDLLCNDYHPIDLKLDHICSADNFPLQTKQELNCLQTEVWFCKFSNDGTKLAAAGLGGKIKIWQMSETSQELVEKCTLDCNSYSIGCLSWSPNDNYLLACGSEDHQPHLWIWDVNKEDLRHMISHSDTEDSTTTCSWHMNGDKFAAASIRGTFNIYDLDGHKCGGREGVRVQCLSFLNKNPNVLLAADTLNRIKAYEVRTNTAGDLSGSQQSGTGSVNHHHHQDSMSLRTDEEDVLEERYSIMSFVVDRDDKFLAVNVMDQGVHLWDLKNKTLLRIFLGVSQKYLTIYSSFSSPDSTFLASGSEDGKVYIYHIEKNQPVAILGGHGRSVNCVSWNPKNPELLASASDDQTVRLWAPMDPSKSVNFCPILNRLGHLTRDQNIFSSTSGYLKQTMMMNPGSEDDDQQTLSQMSKFSTNDQQNNHNHHCTNDPITPSSNTQSSLTC